MGCSASSQAMSKRYITQRAVDFLLNMKSPTSKTIMAAVLIPATPMASSFFDLSDKLARAGCRNTDTTLATARITPISELLYPISRRKAEQKLDITA